MPDHAPDLTVWFKRLRASERDTSCGCAGLDRPLAPERQVAPVARSSADRLCADPVGVWWAQSERGRRESLASEFDTQPILEAWGWLVIGRRPV